MAKNVNSYSEMPDDRLGTLLAPQLNSVCKGSVAYAQPRMDRVRYFQIEKPSQ
jgi:hypothetical protein